MLEIFYRVIFSVVISLAPAVVCMTAAMLLQAASAPAGVTWAVACVLGAVAFGLTTAGGPAPARPRAAPVKLQDLTDPADIAQAAHAVMTHPDAVRV